MKALYNLGLRGNLRNFIKSFLSNRQFRIQIGSTFSNLYKQEEEVPQGSILSVTLFNIKINSITKCLTPEIDGYLYVDDFCITARSKYMRTAECQLQQCIHKIIHWIQDIQKQNKMCSFLSIEENAQQPFHKTLTH